jgi:O-methyltransferase involved in polyketide biosynthesis
VKKRNGKVVERISMTETTPINLGGVSETLLIPLYIRARETQRPDALLRDEKAAEIIKRVDYDFSKIKLQGHDELGLILRVREFDRFARAFLANHPNSTVVHIGCGFDTRFERVDAGRVEWYDLDLPDVIELRRKLIREEGDRYHLLSSSVFENRWMDIVKGHIQGPCLFIAEGVFPYFEEAQLKSLVLKLLDRFPGAELVCDAHTPFVIWTDNLQLLFSRMSARLHWGLKQGQDVESWGKGISLLEEWFYFGTDEPRVRPYRWMRRIPLLGKSTGIFHYRLG